MWERCFFVTETMLENDWQNVGFRSSSGDSCIRSSNAHQLQRGDFLDDFACIFHPCVVLTLI